MSSRKSFRKRLVSESDRWASVGIINDDQKKRILEFYNPPAATGEKSVNKRLPAIIISLAAVLLCSGIILFYAANWKRMPPAVKLIQVFILIIGAYAASYYMLVIRKSNIFVGRVLLIVGMVSYGAGITLVAQIFHISANPAVGILAWATGVLAISIVAGEKWGYYLSSALFFIWNFWEIAVYGNPNYFFVIVPAVLFFLFYRAKAVTGTAIALFMFIFWYYQINIHWIVNIKGSRSWYIPAALFSLTHLPFGVIFVTLGWMGSRNKILKIPSRIYTVAGWFFISAPFLFLSWPQKTESLYLSFHEAGIFQSIEFALLLAIALFFTIFLFKKDRGYIVLFLCTLYSALLFALPLGNNTALMISTHIGLLGLLFGMLLFFSTGVPARKIEYFLSFFIFLLFLAVKSLGLLVLGLVDREFFIVYCIGGLLYVIVSLLINQSVKIISSKKGVSFPEHIITGACALAGYCMLYALSFKVKTQSYIFKSETVVLALSVLFLLIALFLYFILFLKSDRKIIIALSAVVFVPSAIILFITGPKISWIVYSIIFNTMLFVIAGTFIYYSTRINSKILLNFSIAAFFIHVVTRYFDIFWDLLSGSLLFIITGILGIGGGWLMWKIRKNLINKMEYGKTQP